MENQLESQPAALHMTIQIKRKDTGIVETHELVGTGLTVEDCKAAGIAEKKEQE